MHIIYLVLTVQTHANIYQDWTGDTHGTSFWFQCEIASALAIVVVRIGGVDWGANELETLVQSIRVWRTGVKDGGTQSDPGQKRWILVDSINSE